MIENSDRPIIYFANIRNLFPLESLIYTKLVAEMAGGQSTKPLRLSKVYAS